jgi:hypothetical protein
MNQSATHDYRPSTPRAGGTAISTDQAGSNAGGTACPRRSLLRQAVAPAMMAPPVDIDRATVGSDPRPVGTTGHWNQP